MSKKYIYILSERDPDGEVQRMFAIDGLGRAKEFTRRTLFLDNTHVVRTCNFSDEFRAEEIRKAHEKFDNMTITLSKDTWSWTYSDPTSLTWELKRVEVVTELKGETND